MESLALSVGAVLRYRRAYCRGEPERRDSPCGVVAAGYSAHGERSDGLEPSLSAGAGDAGRR